MVNLCDTNTTLNLRLDYTKILRDWYSSKFSVYMELHKKEFEESIPEMTNTLQKNIEFIIQMLYENEQAFVFDLDMGLREAFGNNVELGGGSSAVSNIINVLQEKGIVGEAYPFRLTRGHRDALDLIYLNNLSYSN